MKLITKPLFSYLLYYLSLTHIFSSVPCSQIPGMYSHSLWETKVIMHTEQETELGLDLGARSNYIYIFTNYIRIWIVLCRMFCYYSVPQATDKILQSVLMSNKREVYYQETFLLSFTSLWQIDSSRSSASWTCHVWATLISDEHIAQISPRLHLWYYPLSWRETTAVS